MKLRILISALAVCLLMVTAACDLNSPLNQTDRSTDEQFLEEFLSDGITEASVLDDDGRGDDDDDDVIDYGDDDDDDDDCPLIDPDGPDPYDSEMIPDPNCPLPTVVD